MPPSRAFTPILLSGLMAYASLFSPAQAQSNIRFSTSEGVDNEDLMNVLRFQDIHLHKLTFNGNHLWGKDFKLYIRDFQNGQLASRHLLFDSREDEFFKIKEEQLQFSLLAQHRHRQSVKFDIRFLGFGVSKEFEVLGHQKDFVLKTVATEEIARAFPIGQATPLVGFFMPYKTKNGSVRYPDPSLDQTNIEQLGKRYGIARYFVIDIQFEPSQP